MRPTRKPRHGGRFLGRAEVVAAALAVMTAVAVAVAGAPGGPPDAAAAAAPAVTLVNAFGGTFDVYFDGTLVTGTNGLGEGSAPVSASSGAVTVGVYGHVLAPPASDVGRAGQLQQQTVTVPAAESASIVIGHSPAGGAGLPYVSVFTNDLTPPDPGSGRFVLRHTADAPAMAYEIIQMATVPWTVVARGTLARGAETSVAIPVVSSAAAGGYQPTQVMVTAKPQSAAYALPPLLWATALVHNGEQVIAYAAGPAVRAAPVPNPPACPAPGAIPPGDATNISSATGDFDGDGGPDEVFAWSQVVGANTVWSLGLVPSNGGAGAVTALTVNGPGPVSVLGAADANDDVTDEVFLSMGYSGSFDQVQVWGYGACAFTPVVITGQSAAATFAIGTSGQSRNGVTCSYDEFGGTLFGWNVEPVSTGLQVTRAEYRWNGLLLEPLGSPAVDAISPSEEVVLEWASSLACGVPPLRLVLTQPAVPTPVVTTTTTTVRPVSVTPPVHRLGSGFAVVRLRSGRGRTTSRVRPDRDRGPGEV